MSRKSKHSTEVKERLDGGTKGVADTYSIHEIKDMERDDLMVVQSLLEQRRETDPWGTWFTPKEFIPGLQSSMALVDVGARTQAYIDNDLRRLIDQGPSEQPFIHRLLEDALTSSIRYLVLCCCGPVSLQNQRDSLDRSFVAWTAYNDLPRLAAISITKAMRNLGEAARTHDGVSCFSRLGLGDITHLKAPQHVKTFRRMQMLGGRQLWNDFPSQPAPHLTPLLSGPAEIPLPHKPIQPHKPLPDEYVAEMGWRSQWLMHDLFPNVERVLAGFGQIWEECATAGLSMSTVGTRCTGYLRGVRWTDSNGAPIDRIPFELRLTDHGRRKSNKRKSEEADPETPQSESEGSSWPPKGTSHVFGLARAIQGAHFFIAALSMAARTSEFFSLTRDCLEEADDGSWVAHGKTYKLVLRHDGEARSWGLPAAAVQAVQQQSRMVGQLERLSTLKNVCKPSVMPVGTHLWGRIGGTADRSLPLDGSGLLHLLQSYAKSIGMKPSPGGQNIRIHRLRKTLARLAALALSDAPKILQQCFGHLDIEMTMYYIMTDKDLAAEIENILDELRVMRAVATVQEIYDSRHRARESGTSPSDDFTGKGSGKVRRAVERRERLVQSESRTWKLEDTRAVAEELTNAGKAWILIRPGAICTRVVGEEAPCTKHRGQPNPINCRSTCENLLQHPSMRPQVDRNIQYALSQYLLDIADGRFLAAHSWAAQIRLNIGRFDDLKEKWALLKFKWVDGRAG